MVRALKEVQNFSFLQMAYISLYIASILYTVILVNIELIKLQNKANKPCHNRGGSYLHNNGAHYRHQ